eukprot:4200152-Prymnesium_polylepis.3
MAAQISPARSGLASTITAIRWTGRSEEGTSPTSGGGTSPTGGRAPPSGGGPLASCGDPPAAEELHDAGSSKKSTTAYHSISDIAAHALEGRPRRCRGVCVPRGALWVC